MSAILNYVAPTTHKFSVKRLGRRIRRMMSWGFTRSEVREILELEVGFVTKVLRATRKS